MGLEDPTGASVKRWIGGLQRAGPTARARDAALPSDPLDLGSHDTSGCCASSGLVGYRLPTTVSTSIARPWPGSARDGSP